MSRFTQYVFINYKADEDLVRGEAVYLTSATGVSKAKADTPATMFSIGVAEETVSAGEWLNILQLGILENYTHGLGTYNTRIYVSESTAGELTASEPSSPNVSQVMGEIIDSETLFIHPHHIDINVFGAGFQGSQGYQGPEGSQGYQGSIGYQGLQGITGDVGDQGYQGDQGPQGEQGEDGVQGPPATGALAVVQTRRTTDLGIPSSFADVTLDETNLETSPQILEHDDTLTERINIHEDGIYEIQYDFTVDSDSGGRVESRVAINGTTSIPQTEREITDANDDDDIGVSAVAELFAGDYITLQVRKLAGTHTIEEGLQFNVIKVDSVQGEQGSTGYQGDVGSQGDKGEQGDVGDTGNIGPQGPADGEQGPPGNTGPQGYQGDVGSDGQQGDQGQGYQGDQGYQGPIGSGDLALIQCRKTSLTNIGTSYADVDLDIIDYENNVNCIERDDTFTDRVYLKKEGYYEINYNMSLDAQVVTDYYMRVRLNDTTVLNGSTIHGEALSTYEGTDHFGDSFIYHVGSDGTDYISLQLKADDSGIKAESDIIFTVKKLNAHRGDQGYQGDDGTEGSQGSMGYQGDVGDAGNTGPQGPADGDQGPMGYQGDQGDQGQDGQSGPQGPADGEQGSVGYQGDDGEKGDQGDQGGDGAQGPIGTGSLAVVQTRRTSKFSPNTSWNDVTWDTTDIENNPSVLEHDDSNTERINIHEDGHYLITFGSTVDFPVSGQIRARIKKNGTTKVPGSEIHDDKGSGIDADLDMTVLAELEAGDYITVQLKNSQSGIDTEVNDTIWNVVKLDSTKGDTGPQGPADGEQGPAGEKGDQGNDGSQGPAGTLGDYPALQARRSSSYTLQSSYDDVGLNETDVEVDASVIEHDGVNIDRIQIKDTGVYKITYGVSISEPSQSTNSADVFGRMRVNDSTVIDGSDSRSMVRNHTSYDIDTHLSQVFLANLTSGDFLTLQLKYGSSYAPSVLEGPVVTVVRLKAMQGDVGPQGEDGAAGAQGYQGLGYQGYQGDLGGAGPQGPADGDQGSMGYQGYQGEDGVNGDTGPQGYQGGGGDGDVTAGANIPDNAIVTGDGGAKAIKGNSNAILNDNAGALLNSGSNEMLWHYASANNYNVFNRYTEGTTYRGGFIKYNSADNTFHLGTHENDNADINDDILAVTFRRSNGSVNIGSVEPDLSAKLQVDSTTQGFLPPRMTTTQRNAISSPSESLIIYNTTTDQHEWYDGSAWQAFGGGGGSVFGTEYQYDESEGDSTTTSSTWQQKLRLTTGTLPSGNYRIGWTCRLRNTDTQGEVEARVEIDNTTNVMETQIEPPDTNNTYYSSGFKELNLSGSVDIDLDFRNVGNGTAYIRDARLEIWRVS